MRTDHLAAAQWARDTLAKAPLILDTETTGLHEGEIVQIAVIDHEGKPLLDTLVCPAYPIPQEAFEIHGISDAMVADAPRWPMVAMLLTDLLKDRELIVYNAQYDRRMMHQSADASRMVKTDWRKIAHWHCAMEMYAQFWGDWNSYHRQYIWQRLTAACAQQEIADPVAPAHSALGDCLRTLALLKVMAKAAEEEVQP